MVTAINHIGRPWQWKMNLCYLQTRIYHHHDEESAIEAPALAEGVIADYQSTGLTLRSHPLALLRHRYPFDRCQRQTELEHLGNHASFASQDWSLAVSARALPQA